MKLLYWGPVFTIQMNGFLFFFLFQSIRVTHESSAQEGQTEVGIESWMICVVWG